MPAHQSHPHLRVCARRARARERRRFDSVLTGTIAPLQLLRLVTRMTEAAVAGGRSFVREREREREYIYTRAHKLQTLSHTADKRATEITMRSA